MASSNLAEVLYYHTGLSDIPVFEPKQIIPLHKSNLPQGTTRPARNKSVMREIRASGADGKKEVPIWEKTLLTLEEAAAYTGIGIGKIRRMSDDEKCEFVLWNGTKRLLKRRIMDEYLERAYSI